MRTILLHIALALGIFLSLLSPAAHAGPVDTIILPGSGYQLPLQNWADMSQTSRDAVRQACIYQAVGAPPDDCEPHLNSASGPIVSDSSLSTLANNGGGNGGGGNGGGGNGGGSGSTKNSPKSYALMLYDFAMGRDGGNSCLSCNFMSFFMIGLSDFSKTVFEYFYNLFIALAPITLAIWLGYRVAKLMAFGGEDGRGFLYAVASKVALFTMVWLFAVGANQNSLYVWNASGPAYLDFAFKLTNDIRTQAIQSSNSGNANSEIFCSNVSTPAVPAAKISQYKFLKPAVTTACFTERTHVMGMATGVAVALDSYGGFSLGLFDVGEWLSYMLTALLKIFIGAFVIVVYSISAIWLIFLVLDVVSRGLITAAFSPVLLLLYLYQPTRGVATGAVKAMAGALVTAVSLSIVGILAYVLITNTAKVYNYTYNDVKYSYDLMDPGDWKDIPNADTQRVDAMRTFIERVGETDEDSDRIPMDLGAPWFWYMIFTGVAIFALGKKIIAMLEGLIGYQGASAFADSALKSVRMGATGGAMAAAGTFAIGSFAARRGAIPAAGWLGGAAQKSGVGTISAAGKGLSWGAGKLGYGKNNNVFANSGLGEGDGGGLKGMSATKIGALGAAAAAAQGAQQAMTDE